MSGKSVKQAAAEIRSQHGVFAKREATRYMLQKSQEGHPDEEIFWRSVIEQLISEEQSDPKIYDYLLDSNTAFSTALLNNLNLVSCRASVPSAEDWAIFGSACGAAASYIAALEAVLAKLLHDYEGARLAAIRLLIEGPMEDQD